MDGWDYVCWARSQATVEARIAERLADDPGLEFTTRTDPDTGTVRLYERPAGG